MTEDQHAQRMSWLDGWQTHSGERCGCWVRQTDGRIDCQLGGGRESEREEGVDAHHPDTSVAL